MIEASSNLRCYLPKSEMPPVKDWENKCAAPPYCRAGRDQRSASASWQTWGSEMSDKDNEDMFRLAGGAGMGW
jgi:hypothetical protein